VPTADVGDIAVYYEQGGQGERLLFISGTGSDLRRKPTFLDSPMAGQFSMLGYDQRGLGQSTIPDGPYSMAQYADDAAGLLDAVGWGACLVVGVSFGGMVAQELAIRHGERVQKLVLACTSPGGAGGSSYPLHLLPELAMEERLARQISIMDTRWDAEWQEAHSAQVDMFRTMLEDNPMTKDPEGDAARGAMLQLEARSHHDAWDRLSGIDCPTLVCGGTFDGVASPENSEHLAERIPKAELAMFEGGHMFLVQDPTAFGRITEFLQGAS
jgi:3-oxoadipate enol-lactonase